MNPLIIPFIAFALVPKIVHGESPEPINICYQEYREEMVTAALEIAKKKKMFEEAGLTVHWIENEHKKKIMTEVLAKGNFNPQAKKYYVNGSVSDVYLLQNSEAKKCDFVSTTFEAIAAAKIDLTKILPVATYRYGQDYDVPLVVRKTSNIQSLKDLKGKKVRVNQIGSIIPFENMLAGAGVSPQDLVYSRVPLDKLAQALDDKTVDVVLSYNPTIPLLLGSDRVRVLEPHLFSRFYKHYIPHSLLVVNRSFSVDKHAAYEKFVSVFARAAAELAKKPENMVYALPNVSEHYTNAQIEKSLKFIDIKKPLLITEMTPKDFFAASNFEEYAAILKDRGFLLAAVDLSHWKQ